MKRGQVRGQLSLAFCPVSSLTPLSDTLSIRSNRQCSLEGSRRDSIGNKNPRRASRTRESCSESEALVALASLGPRATFSSGQCKTRMPWLKHAYYSRYADQRIALWKQLAADVLIMSKIYISNTSKAKALWPIVLTPKTYRLATTQCTGPPAMSSRSSDGSSGFRFYALPHQRSHSRSRHLQQPGTPF